MRDTASSGDFSEVLFDNKIVNNDICIGKLSPNSVEGFKSILAYITRYSNTRSMISNLKQLKFDHLPTVLSMAITYKD